MAMQKSKTRSAQRDPARALAHARSAVHIMQSSGMDESSSSSSMDSGSPYFSSIVKALKRVASMPQVVYTIDTINYVYGIGNPPPHPYMAM